MIAVDTNVLVDVLEGDANGSRQALAALDDAAKGGALVVSPAVFAELCAHPGLSPPEVERYLKALHIAIDWQSDATVWRNAGSAFGAYARRRRRARSGTPRRRLADFLIGAHAASSGGLLTRDSAFFSRAFPGLHILAV